MTTIRPALTAEDYAAAYRLRYELYVEGQRLFIDEADHQQRWLHDDYDACSQTFLAEQDGRLVGTSRITLGNEANFSQESREAYDFARFRGIVDEADISVVSRLVVRPELRGGDLGFRLLEACYAYVASHNAELILGNCEPHLVSHYLKLGFRPFGELENHPTNGALVRIAVVTGDFAFLRRFDSPMLSALSLRTRATDSVPTILEAMAKDCAVLCEQSETPHSYRSALGRCFDAPRSASASSTLLAQLTSDEAGRLIAMSQILTCRPGDALFYRGHASRTIYVLLEGSLQTCGEHGATRCETEPGSLVGEAAFFSSGKRLSNAIAGAHGARVLALNERTLRRILDQQASLASKLLQAITGHLARRLERTKTAMQGPGKHQRTVASRTRRPTAASRIHRRARRSFSSHLGKRRAAPSSQRAAN